MGKLGEWLQVGANIGILAGLLMVGLQMQQNERLLKIQLVNQYNEAAAAAEISVGGEEIARAWAKSVDAPEELTLADMRAVEAVLMAPLYQWINLYRLHESGITDENEWKTEVVTNAGYYYGTDYGRAWWEYMSRFFEPPFLPEELEAQINEVVWDDSDIGQMYGEIKRRALEIRSQTPES